MAPNVVPKLAINLKKATVRMVHQTVPSQGRGTAFGSSSNGTGGFIKRSPCKKLLTKSPLRLKRMKLKPSKVQTCKQKQQQQLHLKWQLSKENQSTPEASLPIKRAKDLDSKFEKAFSFIRLVRETFTSQPIMYSAFLQIVKSLHLNPLKSPEAIQTTQEKLLCHFSKFPELLEQFRRQFNVPDSLVAATLLKT